MKTRYITLFFVLLYFLFFNGCATLSMETDAPKLADIVGIDPSEVKFISYCWFIETQKTAEYPILAAKGMVLLTDTRVYVFRGSLSSASKDEIRIPFSDLTGVGLGLSRDSSGDLVAYQLQFLRGEQALVVQIGPTELVAREIPLEEAQQPFDLILAAGVSKWESGRSFWVVRPTGFRPGFGPGCTMPIPGPGFPLF